MIKTFRLDDNYSLQLKKFDGGKQIWFQDNVMNTNKLIAFHNSNGKWENLSHDFFELAKKYNSVFVNNIHKSVDEENEVPLEDKVVCFKRRFNVKLGRALIKLKHII